MSYRQEDHSPRFLIKFNESDDMYLRDDDFVTEEHATIHYAQIEGEMQEYCEDRIRESEGTLQNFEFIWI